MVTIQPATTSAQTLPDRDHPRPIDILILALEETACPWCRGLLKLLKAHLEAFIPVVESEVRR